MKVLSVILSVVCLSSAAWGFSQEDTDQIYDCVLNEFNEHIFVEPSVGEVVWEQARLVVAKELGLDGPVAQKRFDAYLQHYIDNLVTPMHEMAAACVRYYIPKEELAELMARGDDDIEKTFAVTRLSKYFMKVQEDAVLAQKTLQEELKLQLADMAAVTSMDDPSLALVIGEAQEKLGEVIVNTYIFTALAGDQEYRDAMEWLQKRYMNP